MRSKASSSLAKTSGAALGGKRAESPTDPAPSLPALSREERVLSVIKEYATGNVSYRDLARKHDVDPATIYHWILGGVGDKEHAELVTQALTRRIAEADQKLEAAGNYLQLGKAREAMRFTRMDLERRRPNLYGQKQLVAVVGEVRVTGLVGRATELLELKEEGDD